MAAFEKFRFQTLDEIRQCAADIGANLTFQDDLSPLHTPVRIGTLTTPNAMAVLPMEGCDSEPDGSPSELVRRRYRRFAGGGAGLIWYEACAVVPEGRANALQMYMHEGNAKQFAALLKEANREALDRCGHKPVSVLQLTHSGRYCRPVGHKAAPIIPQHDPLLDPRVGLSSDDALITDDALDALIEKYVASAVLAREAGFDGVDIKACHRYLISELLASHTREGKYGGSFEHRIRFLLDVIDAVKKAVGTDFLIACRFNVYDAHPYPYGFGVDKDDWHQFDLTEPLQLVKALVDRGVGLLSNSAGNPYFRFPQVTRPFDTPAIGGEIPDEHPLQSVARLFDFSRQIQSAAGDVPVIGNGYTWLRQFLPHAGAANLSAGDVQMIGTGRESFAYPNAPRDIVQRGGMDKNKVCIACSKCTQIMRDHGRTGCVIRDGAVYSPLYQEARQDAIKRES